MINKNDKLNTIDTAVHLDMKYKLDFAFKSIIVYFEPFGNYGTAGKCGT